MSLTFSDSSVNFSYSNFAVFRHQLAQEIGLNLKEMQGFGGDRSWDEIDDPIKPLLNHSDHDGHLTADELRQVAPRLRQLTFHWPDSDTFRQRAQQLAFDMEVLLAEEGDNAILKFL